MALRDQPYLPLYVMDFLSDEKLANCSAESTGVYIRFLCIMHKMEDYGVVTLKSKDKQDNDNLVNFASKLVKQMPYSVEVIRRSLEELVEERVLTIDGDKLYQKRMVRDGEISIIRAASGKKGGSVKKGEQKESKTQSKTEANDEPKQKKASLQEEHFEKFWKEYPKKVGKGGARKSWLRISPDGETFNKIMEALRIVKNSPQWHKENGQFIPHATTWLNQTRWEDGDDDTSYYDENDPFKNYGEANG